MNAQALVEREATAGALARLPQPGTVIATADLDLPKAHARKPPLEKILLAGHPRHPGAFICILELALFILIVLPIFCLCGVGGIFQAIGDRKHLRDPF